MNFISYSSATGLLQNLRPLLNPPNGDSPKTGLLGKTDNKSPTDPDLQTKESSSTLSSISVKSDLEVTEDGSVLASMAAGDLVVENEEKTDSNLEHDNMNENLDKRAEG